MSESEKKEQNQTDQPKAVEGDDFVAALKKDGDEGLKEAFQILSKGEPTARVEAVHLQRAVATRGPGLEISVQHVNEIIHLYNKEGLFKSEEFVDLVNMIVALEAVKKDDAAVWRENAFNILKKDGPTVRVEDVQLAVVIRGPELLENAKKIIPEVDTDGKFNYEEFVAIFRWLEDPGEENQTKKIYEELKKQEKNIILYGSKGVGKTWTAGEVAALAVREGGFDFAIWVYLNRIYEEELSLHKSIASQLSVLADFEKYVADEAKKKEEKAAEEAKKKEPKKKDKDGVDEITEKEAKEKIEELIEEAVEKKKILFILDDDNEGRINEEAVIIIKPVPKKENEKSGGDQQKKEEGEKSSSTDETEKEEKEGEKSGADETEKEEKEGEKSGADEREKKKRAEEEKEREVKEIDVLVLKSGGRTIEVPLGSQKGSLESYKILTTSAKKYQGELSDNEIIVKPLTWDESKSMTTRAIAREGLNKNNIKERELEELEELARYFMFRSDRLPAQLLLISRIVSYFGKKEDLRLKREKEEKGESGLQKLRGDREKMKKKGGGVKLLDVLIKGYEERLPKSVLIDCYSPYTPDGHFMHRHRMVTFNDLICYWIMEGHLGPSPHIDEIYFKGHRVLMELMDCGLLHKQEGDYVALSGETSFNFHIQDYRDFFQRPRPGLGVTFDMRLGEVVLADGMIRTISSMSSNSKGDEQKNSKGDGQKISALLLDGNRIGEEERPTESLRKHKDLVEILAISDPTSQHFELPILEMPKLRLLALRGCQFLDSLERYLFKKSDQENDPSVPVKKSEEENDQSPQTPMPQIPISEKLEGLTVLEISGPSPLVKSIPDELFKLMPNLKTLNLSQLHEIELLPPSFYSLTQIEFLILRGCKSLKELKSIKTFKDLKVLDISEATSFEKFDDKSLHSNTKLQILNLSKTKLKTLPLINQLKELKFVWLGDCQELPRIRKIDKMENLKIFDIAGAKEVERFCDPSLEDLKCLMIVDISRTKIRRLPANIGDPTYLYAKDCVKLRVVPPVEGLEKLKVLDLSGCIQLREVREEFFAKVKRLRELNLSKTRVEHLPFLSSLLSLRRLLLSECNSLEKLEKLSCLVKLETLDLSGCEKVMELEDGSFDKMIRLRILNLSRTGLGDQQKPLPSLSKLESLEKLYVRDCPNLTELPGVEEVPNLEVLDYSGTVLESPPSFMKQDHPRVVGAGIESINTIQLFENLGAQQQVNDQDAKWDFKREEVSQCKWIISNSRVENEEEKLGVPVYGAHFLRLLNKYPLFLEDNLSKFRFLVYPSEAEAEATVKTSFPDKNSYGDEVSLREIYFEQVCEGKMERCLEIREFNELPESLHPLIKEAEFVVLINDTFLKSLLDLHVDCSMRVKACWIESCNELEHVVAAPEKAKITEEAAKSEDEQGKNAAAGKSSELVKGDGDQHKKIAAEKGREAAKGKGVQQKNERLGEALKGGGDQQKNAADKKAGESAKSEGVQPKNVAADNAGETAKGEGNEQKNAADTKSEEKSEEPAKNEGDQPKNAAVDKTGDSAKIEGDQQKNAAEEKSVDSAKNEGNEQKTAAEEKSEEPAKNEGDQPRNAAVDKTGDSAKIEGDQQKNAAEEKSVDSAKNEGNEQKTAAEEKSEEPAKNEGDQSKNAAVDKTGDSAKIEADQQKNAAEEKSVDSAKNEGNEQKTAAEEKSEEPAKNEDDQPKNAAADNAGDQQKNTSEEKSVDSSKNEGNEQKTAAEEKSEEPAKNEDDQPKNAAADNAGDQQKNTSEEKSVDSSKNEGNEQKTAPDEKSEEPPKIEGDQLKNDIAGESAKVESKEVKNAAENLNKVEILWISDVLKMKSVCKGDIESVSFKFLKSLYLEFCPDLTAICSSSLQLQSLETLYIKYCQKLKSLFEDDNPSKMEKLRHLQLWGLDSLEKINCKTPLLRKLRVGECPLLEHVMASRLTDAEAKRHETEGHENLEILHIKSCDGLKSIFESEQDQVYFERLDELELQGLPLLQKVAQSAPALRTMRVGDCPSLLGVFPAADQVPNLQTVEVRSCEKMKTIIQGGGSKLMKVTKLELLGLPELEYVGAELPGEEGCIIWACPKLKKAA